VVRIHSPRPNIPWSLLRTDPGQAMKRPHAPGANSSYPWEADSVITDPTEEKIWLIDVAMPGISAPAATATKPAIKAYSTRS
jgi:hypothetical protein